MKDFFSRHYHWVALGVSTIVVLVSAGLLITWSMQLSSTFTAYATATSAVKSPAPQPSNDAADALAHLKEPILWNLRDDGASPLVSRAYLLKDGVLIDPMEGDVPLYPPVKNSWLVKNKLDYTDMNILSEHPFQKGFTVLEEYTYGTDPSNPKDIPPLYHKLYYTDDDIRKSDYTFEFVDEEDTDGKQELELRPTHPVADPDKGGKPDTSPRTVVKGDTVPGAPFLQVTDYQPKKKTINDTDYDVSEVTLSNSITKENYTLIKRYGERSYKPTPIELIESVTFHYRLTGAPEEVITVERGKEFPLTSLDKKLTETYKLNDFSNGGIHLEKDGRVYTVNASNPQPSPTPSAKP